MKLTNVLVCLAVVGLVGGMVLGQDTTSRPARGLRGTIVKVDGANVVVKTMARPNADAKEVTVVTDEKTVVTLDGKPAKLADLKADLNVNVSPDTGTANNVDAKTTSQRGQVVKVDGVNLVVKTRVPGGTDTKEVTVVTDAKTVVTLDEKEAKLADLKADVYVTVTPVTGTAVKVVASTKAPVRPGGPRGGAGGGAPAN